MVKNFKEFGFTLRWLLQAGLGALLVVLLTVHLLVNHWLVPQSLLGYADIVHYYNQPGIIWMESIFLTVVTLHCLLGLYAIVLDLNVSPRIAHSLAQALILIGVFVILYGLWLIASIHSLSMS